MAIESNRSTIIRIDGKDYLYFGGTNYLGLAHRPELWKAAEKAFQDFGFSSGASRLTSGETVILLGLERELAEFAESESSLVLPAGFMSNTAVVDALSDKVDYWIISKYAHGSIKTAVAQTGKVMMVDNLLPQSAVENRRSLRGRLGLRPESRLAYFAEPIDPLLGTLFDLPSLHSTLAQGDYLVLDEAHSFGVLGEKGRGALEHFSIKPSPQIVRTGTFSKAFGAQGGFVLGDGQLIDMIKCKSNSFKVSTPLSPVSCASSRESLRLVASEPESPVKKLKDNVAYANSRLAAAGFSEMTSNVVPIYHLPDSPAVRNLRERLPGMGMYLPSVTSYFADFCEIGLRWTLQAGHDREQLDKLFDAISEACSSPGKR